MSIRFANEEDAENLLRIYAQYIKTQITFEETLPSVEEFTHRISDVITTYPYLVWEENGILCGYAYAHKFRERAAYGWGVELSIYIDQDHHRKGIGRELFTKMEKLLALQGVKMCYSGVTLPNEKSEGLHMAMGYNYIGAYKNAGYKNGKWHDVGWFEKQIGELCVNPQPVIKITDLDVKDVQSILQ